MKKKNIFAGMGSFMLLWVTQSISAMGTAMTNYAIVVWTYGHNGTASSVTLLTLCSFMPTILLRFLAGALADRWDKKRTMLISDFLAACGTLMILILHASSALTMAHLYVINFLLSCMNAFQVPASYVATSLLVHREQYSRAGGLQAVSGAMVSILSPALAGMLLAWGGMSAVLLTDLATFGAAFLALLTIRIPKAAVAERKKRESLAESCSVGFRYLKEHPLLLRMILYIAAVNFLAKLGPDGLLSAFILGRTQGDQTVLGRMQSMVALGLLTGGMLVTAAKTSASSMGRIIGLCCLIFLTGIGVSVSRDAWGWGTMLFLQYLFAAMMNVHWNTMLRSSVPMELQGRVCSVRDTLQNCTIPVGLYLGGVLADHVFQPMMEGDSAVRNLLEPLIGDGSGAGLGVQFLLVSSAGLILSLICLSSKKFRIIAKKMNH